MSVAIAIVFAALVTVVPVMIAANIVKARNSGFFSCLIAVALSIFIMELIKQFLNESVITHLLTIIATVVIIMLILNTKFIQSVLIAILSVVIQIIGVSLISIVLTNIS